MQRWIDDANEQLSNMMRTCSLDVVDQYPDGLAESSVAMILGVTEQAINAETRTALIKFRVEAKNLAPEHGISTAAQTSQRWYHPDPSAKENDYG